MTDELVVEPPRWLAGAVLAVVAALAGVVVGHLTSQPQIVVQSVTGPTVTQKMYGPYVQIPYKPCWVVESE